MNAENIISHYTTLSGFKSIIETSTLWATNVNFLNDNKEYLHAFETFRKSLKEFSKKLDKKNDINNFFILQAHKATNQTYSEGASEHYTISFSKKYDQLSQWRAYGQIGIIFDEQILFDSTEGQDDLYVKKSECQYSKKTLQKKIYEKLKSYLLNIAISIKQEKKTTCMFYLLIFNFFFIKIRPFTSIVGSKKKKR